ncbi:UrvD/REP family ATP-dependent DNA helicase [Pseudactinotalea sp. HY158]|uniref:UrvD/REP family ATP-dependent DNA helicase n=1 Tax=Pseudactinotalea sp. HY158 TaxID=2654547 RepID=UPI00129CF62C|nr:UrvD/REP family ATP-dependent DNA helicase [Pseudactinotalea sp. HY158]QGH70276.1 AAA family ATPase [Pseudactinotalea sp. HY158]
MTTQLVPPRSGLRLDAAQQEVHDAVLAGGNHVVLGPPGSGKTTTAVEVFLDWCRANDPDRAVLLVPSRRAAALIGEEVSARLGRTTSRTLVRTPASLAFTILRLAAQRAGRPAPTLLTGPDQDQILGDLIEGHLSGEGARVGWPDAITPQMQRLRAFRDELRDLLMRAAEAGLDGPSLEEWGHRHDRPEWVAAGRVLAEYTDVTVLGELTPDRGARYDASTILDQAVQVLARAGDPLGDLEFVVHDDYQDATLATARLLGELDGTGARVAAFAEPDVAVQSFRGAVPALVHTATRPVGSGEGALGARTHLLATRHRHGGELAGFVHRLSLPLPPIAVPARRRPPVGPPGDAGDGADAADAVDAADGAEAGATAGVERAGGAVELRVLGSPAQEHAYIARRLREAHLLEGVPWSRLAVIVRGHQQLVPVRRQLRLAGIPLQTQAPDRPLREEAAVLPFLLALEVVTREEPSLTGPEAIGLLTSVIGGVDPVGLRRLRRELRAAGAADSADLLAAALADPDLLAGLPPTVRAAPAAMAAMLAAGRAAHAGGLGTEMVLWRMWQALDLADTWQERALAGGAGADRADADLDAMVALFTAAEQFTDRTAGAGPSAFLHHLAGQDFPADTLAARATQGRTVAVHTAASAAGGEWEVVIVAGVQDEVWPDLRIRDTVLGAAHLADIASQRHGPETATADVDRWRLARRQVRDDELRTFVSACSRARSRLLLTCVLDTDTRPSGFLDALLPAGDAPPITRVEPPLDLRGLVGRLRAAARPAGGAVGAPTGVPSARARAAGGLLRDLARAQVREADPSRWPGLVPWSSDLPLVVTGEPDAHVTVSPSAIETAVTCPLRWFLTAAGGQARSSNAQNVGDLVHDIAADLPRAAESELLAELERRWPELGLPETALARRERARAEVMMHKLAGYVASHGYEVETERAFEVRLPTEPATVLRGRVDRIEHRADGPHIVDLKTGKVVVPADEVPHHPQLGAYQLAVDAGAFDADRPAAGASLVYVGSTHKSASVREQGPLADAVDPGWAREMVEGVAETMAGGEFTARVNDTCRSCPVRRSCPVQDAGARLGRPGTTEEA